MRIALAQINSIMGNFAENRRRILDNAERARSAGCDLVVFPEACLFGYHPVDLLSRPSVVKAQMAEFEQLVEQVPDGVALLVGLFRPNSAPRGKPYFNSAALLQKGQQPRFFDKELLPTYDVFDEGRHIEPGKVANGIFELKGQRILVTICEDIWAWGQPGRHNNYSYNPLAEIDDPNLDLVVNLSASPFTDRKRDMRLHVTKQTVKHFAAPMVYVNLVGAQDELIFDGASFALNARGNVIAQSPPFCEHLNILYLEKERGETVPVLEPEIEVTRQALVLGIQDFARKINIDQIHLGLSGGIDSAVVACLAVDALGASKVRCVAMPGPYNAPESRDLALQLTRNLHCQWVEMPIGEAFETVSRTIQTALEDPEFGVLHENVQARLRGLYLMALTNRYSSLLLTTANKDELATGFCTLYGDMCGGLAPIGDLVKGQVYALAQHYNRQTELIPQRILTRDPSPELRPNQRDQDRLPPYPQLDAMVEKLADNTATPNSESEKWVLESLLRSEFKRWQAPPVLKVTEHAFGRGRRWPIVNQAII